MRSLFVFLTLFLALTDLQAQKCGTIVTEEQMEFIISIEEKGRYSTERTKAVDIRVPIQFHFVTRDDGSGGLSSAEAINILNRLNGYYSRADMEFFFFNDVNLIRQTEDYDWDGSEGNVAASNDIRGVINVYFFNSIVTNGTPLCGYTRFPPSSDRVFVTYSCVTGGTTLEHELGHYFTLFHTHGTTNTGTTDELVNGSNCSNAGDRLCDTPADPNLSGKVSNCVYVGNDTDANGDIYNPQVENIMSYAPDQCQDLFTPGQYEKIRTGFELGRLYLNWETDQFTGNFTADQREICNESSVGFDGIGFGVTSWEWEFEGGTPSTSQLQNPSVTYNDGGNFDVKLLVRNNVGTEVEIVKRNYIQVSDPLLDARTDTILYNFSQNEVLLDFSVENPDEGVTFERSETDFESGTGSLFINNYDYLSETPGNIDVIHPGNMNTIGVYKYKLSFDYAYTYRPGLGEDTFIYDSLEIVFNTGCLNNDVSIWKKGGRELASTDVSSNAFVPLNQNEWRHLELEYQLSGEESAIFKFINTSYNGNNLYIDNLEIIPDLTLLAPDFFRIVDFESNVLTIRWVDQSFNELGFTLEKSFNGGEFEPISLDQNTQIYLDTDIGEGVYEYRLFATGRSGITSDTVGVISFDNTITSVESRETKTNDLAVYPNPSSGNVWIQSARNGIMRIVVLNIIGSTVLEQDAGNLTEVELLTEKLKPGPYTLKIHTKNKVENRRIFIK